MRNNYRPALIKMAELLFEDKKFDMTKLYLERYHSVGEATARSLWLDIRNSLETSDNDRATGLAKKLATDFPDSRQYKAWLELQQ